MEELRQAKIRVTVQREEVLTILKDSDIPLSLNQIRDKTGVDGMDLSTLYRILDLFEEKNIITKTVLMEPLESVYGYNRKSHRHLLICIECKRISVIAGCPLHDYEDEIAKESGYIISNHQLDLYGVCPECQRA